MYFTSVNRRTNPFIMKDDELWDAVNFWTDRKIGEKKVRPGLTLFLNQVDSSPVKGFAYIKFPNGYKRLARFSSNKIYAIDPDSDSTWGTADHTLASGNFNKPEYTVLAAKGHIVDRISDSNSPYIHWTNSAGTDSFTATNYVSGADLVVPYSGATITTFHRRVYNGNVWDRSTNVYRSRISWSSIDYTDNGADPASPYVTDDADITTANFRNIDLDYKGNILKLTNINDRLNIYKEEGIYRYNESSVFELFGLSPVEGSIATMQETKEDFFFTNEGFFKTNGQEVTPIGDGWYPIIKEILANGITASKIHSYAVNFLYFCYMGDITYDGKTLSNACFVYNSFYGEMNLFSFNPDITAIGHYVDASKEKIIIMGDSNGYTYKFDYDSDTDNGSKIQAFFQTKHFFFDSPHLRDLMAHLFAFANKGAGMKMSIIKDFSDDPIPITDVTGYFNDIKVDSNKLGYFKTISFKFYWNGTGKRPSLYGILPLIQQTSERKDAEK